MPISMAIITISEGQKLVPRTYVQGWTLGGDDSMNVSNKSPLAENLEDKLGPSKNEPKGYFVYVHLGFPATVSHPPHKMNQLMGHLNGH